MPSTAQTTRLWFLAALEGVGSYGTGDGATLLIADAQRAQVLTAKNTPSYENRTDPSPARHGGGAVRTGATNDFEWNAFAQDYTVLETDDVTRPPQHTWLEGHGFIQAWDIGGGIGVGPYTRTYTLQDNKDTQNSFFMAVPRLMSDLTTMKMEIWNGARGTGIVTFTPGHSIMYAGSGKMIGYVGPTDVTPLLANPTFDRSPEVHWASLLTAVVNIMGGATYSGPVSAVEMRSLQNISETPGGGLDGVSEVTSIATGPYELDFQVDDQTIAAVNMKEAMDNDSIVQIIINQPTPTAGNVLKFLFQCQITSIDPVDVGERQMLACKAIGVWPHATTPGQIPAAPFTIIYETTP